jgi:hypothetical protein
MQLTLITPYYYVCKWYNSKLGWQVQSFSPNSLSGQISDPELITIYLFCTAFQEKTKLKSLYKTTLAFLFFLFSSFAHL